ncbi:hypothetical protein LUZ62_078607 [Rhynchospora pubera]|uniref:Uncharacterized protein n=1 Tax=Rhynchospora pubera TaxID=906938 RepID=A0AAV8DI66_9POAL|nr:hypothetical protein LUZ62_078607 [Rhynchospora pubera]
MAAQIPLTKQTQLRLQELDGMDEKRLAAQQNLELYQVRMTRAYEKLSRPRTFKKGELVLILRRPILGRHHGPKFAPNWEGPYVIEQAYEGGAYLLADSNGKHPVSSINGRYLKKYYGQNYPDVPAAHRSQRKSNQQTDWADNCEAVNHLFA